MTTPAGRDAGSSHRPDAIIPEASQRAGPATEGRPARPLSIEVVSALLVFGGLFGITQLLFGDFVITGRLPAKGPILGVAAIFYAASVVLGATIRTGRGWFPTLNLAVLFAIVYLAAFSRATALLLGAGHAVAALLLIRDRAWFAATARRRDGKKVPVTTPGPDAGPRRGVDQGRARVSRRGGRSRPSSRR